MWRQKLPATVARLVEQWSLTIDQPFPALSYNYAAPAIRADGTAAVLKVWFPNTADFEAEAEALRLYSGQGAVRLFERDAENRALLLERAEPGANLWQLGDEASQIEVLAEIMRRLWRSVPVGSPLPPAAAQWDRMTKVAPQIVVRGFPLDRVMGAKVLFDELANAAMPAVLHGDLHQANILSR